MYGAKTNNRIGREDAIRRFENELWRGRDFNDVYALLEMMAQADPNARAARDTQVIGQNTRGNYVFEPGREMYESSPDYVANEIRAKQRIDRNGDPGSNEFHDYVLGPLASMAGNTDQWERESRYTGKHRSDDVRRRKAR